jgi:hypothetical protein
MKLYALLSASLLLTTLAAQAGTVSITTGTPSNASTLPATLNPSPNLGGLIINFDTANLEPPNTTCVSAPCSSLTIQGVTFSSPNGIQVIPFSTQSGPNELFDVSPIGGADLSITLTQGVGAIGVGIADSDLTDAGAPVTITLEALGTGGTVLSTFNETISETNPNPGNAYFVISDTTPDLFGLNISTAGNSNNTDSGLAIDDVQVVPEPSSWMFLASGIALLFGLRKFKRA